MIQSEVPFFLILLHSPLDLPLRECDPDARLQVSEKMLSFFYDVISGCFFHAT